MSLERPRHSRSFVPLPVLENLESLCSGPERNALRSCALVAVQHLLETTGSLFESLIALGLPPRNIFVLGKLYSASKSVQQRLRSLGVNVFENGIPERFGSYCDQFTIDVKRLWGEVLDRGVLDRVDRIVILDDGGYAITQTPKSVLSLLPVHAVEQTMSGIEFTKNNCPLVPIVDVASSAAKTLLEPKLIWDAVQARIASAITDAPSFGVVGLGNIGSAVAVALSKSNRPVFLFDKEDRKIPSLSTPIFCGDVSQVFQNASVIFGCTGSDFLEGESWWGGLEGQKTLISCSSHDQEFRAVLRQARPAHVRNLSHLFATVKVATGNGELSVLRGGFPINFDGSIESVKAMDIQLTRGLLLAGTLQAISNAGNGHIGREPLSPTSQKRVVSCWFKSGNRKGSYPLSVSSIFANEELIQAHSRDAEYQRPEQPLRSTASLCRPA